MASIPGRLLSILLLVLPFMAASYLSSAEPIEDKQALLEFLDNVPHSNRLDWDPSGSACGWSGVVCDRSRTYVSSLRLPAVGLVAEIPAGTIGRLSQLRVLSLRSNGLYGQIPEDFSNLTLLRSLFLQNNRFSGEFPESLTRLARLNRLDLSSNNFSGAIPFGINNLTHISRLDLQDNSFSGELPSIYAAVAGGSLVSFNVSNNKLNGSIPQSLARFPESSFTGNLQLCGGPMSPCNGSLFSPPPSPTTPSEPVPPSSVVPSSPAEQSRKKLSAAGIAALAVALAVVFFILLFILIVCLIRRRRQQPSKSPKRPPGTAAVAAAATPARGDDAGTSSSKSDPTSGAAAGERSKLVFLNAGEGIRYNFDLEDLLRASAEVLGKGSIGTTYKAVLEEGTTVVVKRLKDVTASKREFEMQMAVLSGCSHENVVPLRAYYYSKDEKLLVFDYFRSGSLSALLHGNRGSGRTTLDWDGRMRMALGAARGLTYLHQSGEAVHGNIKSSNILVRQDCQEALISDYSLIKLFGNSTPYNKVNGYRAPEVLETRRATLMSDVYSFGVLLLELLTGKAPNQASFGDEGIDLPRWVQSVVQEEWTAEVFDLELTSDSNAEEAMVQLLQIGISCVQMMPDQRPTMPEVLHMMEGISRGMSDNSLRQPSDDPPRGSASSLPA